MNSILLGALLTCRASEDRAPPLSLLHLSRKPIHSVVSAGRCTCIGSLLRFRPIHVSSFLLFLFLDLYLPPGILHLPAFLAGAHAHR